MNGRAICIGRDRSCTIVLNDSRVSREHALIEPCDGGSWLCRDLQSTNSTYVNDEPVTAELSLASERRCRSLCYLNVIRNALLRENSF